MTGWIGLCILLATAWLSFRYRPAERDSFLLMGLCLFCGGIALLSGVESMSMMSWMLTAIGVIMLGLYRSQLRAQRGGQENVREVLPLGDEEEPDPPCLSAGCHHKNIVA